MSWPKHTSGQFKKGDPRAKEMGSKGGKKSGSGQFLKDNPDFAAKIGSIGGKRSGQKANREDLMNALSRGHATKRALTFKKYQPRDYDQAKDFTRAAQQIMNDFGLGHISRRQRDWAMSRAADLHVLNFLQGLLQKSEPVQYLKNDKPTIIGSAIKTTHVIELLRYFRNKIGDEES